MLGAELECFDLGDYPLLVPDEALLRLVDIYRDVQSQIRHRLDRAVVLFVAMKQKKRTFAPARSMCALKSIRGNAKRSIR